MAGAHFLYAGLKVAPPTLCCRDNMRMELNYEKLVVTKLMQFSYGNVFTKLC